MRTLHLIPMIHAEADMGAAANGVRQAQGALYGADRLARHREVMTLFWERVTERLNGVPPSLLKIYQDGLVEGGEVGRLVVRDLAGKGSPNFRCVASLVAEGGELRKTESLALVQKEHALAMGLVQARSRFQVLLCLLRVRFYKKSLLKKRDRFIARQINTTLQEGEVGVLFIGADHDVVPSLDAGIGVFPFKPPRLLQAYLKAMKGATGDADFTHLADAMIE